MTSQYTNQLISWIKKEEFQGWDPFDALNSRLLKTLSFSNQRFSQGWVQLLKLAPVNIRNLLEIRKEYNPKGMGLFLSTYARRFLSNGKSEELELAKFFAGWLKENRSPGYHGEAWGYNFDWPNRNFFARAGTPTVVNTAFIGMAFLDFDDALYKGGLPSGDGLAVASSACNFILKDLNHYDLHGDELCLSYTPIDHRYVHNANVLGGWLLSSVSRLINDSTMGDAALRIARFTSRFQQKNGAWLYGVNAADNWIDNFHTGYVLMGLKAISRNLGIHEFDDVIQKGYLFWKENFFLSDGTPKYYPHRTYPIDAHCAAQGILTFLDFADQDPEAFQWAQRVAEWVISHMQSREGYFYYQILPHYINRIPYMRWTQAWMLRALTELQIQIEGK